MIFKRVFLLVFVILIALSCEKDDLTKPTKVVIGLNLSNDEGFYVSADSGAVFVSNFEFAGVREIGPDVYFNTSLDGSIEVPLTAGRSTKVQEFDIPIGTYLKIATKLSILFDSNVEKNKKPRLRLVGKFLNTDGDIIPFEFVSMLEKVVQAVGAQAGGGKVELNLGVTSYTDYVLHPNLLFRDVSQEVLSKADLSTQAGVRKLIISESSNNEIYKKVVSRIDQSFELLFNTTN